MSEAPVAHPPIVARDEWLEVRKKLLAEEKALTKALDAVNAKRRRLPMVRLEKDYVFEGPQGRVRLRELFGNSITLIVYHFMLDPEHVEGCDGCSHVADNIPHLAHLKARRIAFSMVSRARYPTIAAFKARMGWTMPWVSSWGSDFNYDFHATNDDAIAPVEYNYCDRAELEAKGHTYHMKGEQPGLSVFLRRGDDVFHTYSTYGRGLDIILATHHLFDMTPYGRGEDFEDSPPGWPKGGIWSWLRHHDRYDDPPKAASCCHN